MTRLGLIKNVWDTQGFVPKGEEGYLLQVALQAKLVREKQSSYFKSRSREDLLASKQAESALDKLLSGENKSLFAEVAE